MKLAHTPPQDSLEAQIVSEVNKAQASLKKARDLCQRRLSARMDDGQSLRGRYKDTARSLEVVMDTMRSIKGFGPMPQVKEAPAPTKVKESNASKK